MKPMTVRARLALWHSGLLGLLVLAFAVASYAFLRRTELRRIDSMLREQSEIMTQAMRSMSIRSGVAMTSADTGRILDLLHDLRTRGVRVWVFDALRRPFVSTTMVHENEGEAEERRVLGDALPAAAVRDAATDSRAGETTRTVHTDDATHERARVFGTSLATDLGGGTIVVSYSLRDLDALLSNARTAAVIAVVVAFLLSALAGYGLARRSLRPVTDMSVHADEIGAENLHERLPVANPHDELGVLAATFNRLLDRVASAFEHQRRFMADASHELRTPVAIVRGEAEVALASEGRSQDAYRDALIVVRDAADRLTRTVNDIFLLARVDARQVPASPVPLYFDELVVETCRSMRSLAAQRGIALHCDAPVELPYVGDEPLLQRLVMNLVDNAIKYSDDCGTVSVGVSMLDDRIALTVSNGGPGIPPEARQHVFDRFFRADPARTHRGNGGGSGSGLGLSIARWIAEQHAGRLELSEASPAITTFTLSLPREPALTPSR